MYPECSAMLQQDMIHVPAVTKKTVSTLFTSNPSIPGVSWGYHDPNCADLHVTGPNDLNTCMKSRWMSWLGHVGCMGMVACQTYSLGTT